MLDHPVYPGLVKQAQFAQTHRSGRMLREVYGMAKMAWQLRVISNAEMAAVNQLTVHYINTHKNLIF